MKSPKLHLSLALCALMALSALTSCKDADDTSTTTTASTDASTPATPPADSGNMAPAADPNATPATPAATAMTDQEFVTKASAMNMAEINAHKAAGTHAVTADVKGHAKMMLTDHTKMGADMKALAAKKSLTLATEPLPEKAKMLEDMNATKKGQDWDAAYIAGQITDHQEAIALFQAGSSAVKDADLKALIDATIPKLQEHLKMVQDAQGKIQ